MRRHLGLFFLCLLAGTSLFAQTTSLTGTVSDPSGAVIPNATITIVDLTTGTRARSLPTIRAAIPCNCCRRDVQADSKSTRICRCRNRESGIAGQSAFDDSYCIHKTRRDHDNRPGGGDGGAGEHNRCLTRQRDQQQRHHGSADVRPQRDRVAGHAAGRYVLQLVWVASGGSTPNSRDGSVNGGKPDQGNVTLDGADVNDQNARAAFTTVLRVTLDSVEEFRSTTTNGDAATGRGSGADVTLVTKSGSNEYHGSLYEYRRGTETAANSFFNNQSGVPVAPLLINVFGGALGAPIRKNKLFYFLNYEGRRDRSSAQVTRTVPTETLKQGIVQYVDKNGVTQQVGPAQLMTIDPAGIGVDPAALKLLQGYPKGNDTAIGDQLNTTGYLFNAPQPTDQNTYIAKLDYKIDDAGKHSLFLRGNLQNDSTYGTPQFPGLPSNQVFLANSKGLATGWTGVLTPNLVNTLHYGFTRAGNQQTGVLAGPYTYFRGFDVPYGTTTGLTHIIPVHTISDDLSWNHGAHDIRVGGGGPFNFEQLAELLQFLQPRQLKPVGIGWIGIRSHGKPLDQQRNSEQLRVRGCRRSGRHRYGHGSLQLSGERNAYPRGPACIP